MDLLFGFPNVLFVALLTRQTVDDITRFTCNWVPDHKGLVSGRQADIRTERAEYTGLAPFITTL